MFVYGQWVIPLTSRVFQRQKYLHNFTWPFVALYYHIVFSIVLSKIPGLSFLGSGFLKAGLCCAVFKFYRGTFSGSSTPSSIQFCCVGVPSCEEGWTTCQCDAKSDDIMVQVTTSSEHVISLRNHSLPQGCKVGNPFAKYIFSSSFT